MKKEPFLLKPIPVKWYVDNQLTTHEIKILNLHPFYLGSKFALPHHGDFVVSEPTFKSIVLTNNLSEFKAISNICRHRQSLLLEGHGNKKVITCPVHYWKYSLDGRGLLAYHFDKKYDCPSLPTIPMTEWGPLLFKENPTILNNLNQAQDAQQLKKRSYVFKSIEIIECFYNWKTFIETYLDLYHINVIHPGLRKFACCESATWDIKSDFSSQAINVLLDENNPSPHYSTYAKLIRNFAGSEKEQKIIWFCLYPNTMIEFYPYNLIITSVIPISAQKSLNIIEFYMDAELQDYKHGDEMHIAFKRAYLETAAEDDHACRLLQKGREALYQNNQEDHGPYHDPLEVGIPSFYAYWQRNFNL